MKNEKTFDFKDENFQLKLINLHNTPYIYDYNKLDLEYHIIGLKKILNINDLDKNHIPHIKEALLKTEKLLSIHNMNIKDINKHNTYINNDISKSIKIINELNSKDPHKSRHTQEMIDIINTNISLQKSEIIYAKDIILEHPELYKSTLLLDLTDKQYDMHLDKLNTKHGEYKNDYNNRENLLELYKDEGDLYEKVLEDIEMTKFKIEFISDAIENAKNTRKLNNIGVGPTSLYDLNNYPIVITVGENENPNLLPSSNKGMELVDTQKFNKLINKQYKRDITIGTLIANTEHIGVIQDIVSGDIEDVQLNSQYLLSKEQTENWMLNVHPEILTKLEMDNLVSINPFNDLNVQKKDLHNNINNFNFIPVNFNKDDVINHIKNKINKTELSNDASNVYNFMINNHNVPFDQLDFDNDGLTNSEEFYKGTSIYSSDTDGNGISDKNELPEGSKYRIQKDKNNEFTIQKKHSYLGWRNLKPSNNFKDVVSKDYDKIIKTYTDIQTADIKKSKSHKL